MKPYIAVAMLMISVFPAGSATAAAQNGDGNPAFSASVALLSPNIDCQFKYPSDSGSNTVAGLARQAGFSVREMLISFERERLTHERDFAISPGRFCKKISDTLLNSAGLDVGKDTAPEKFSAPPAKPETRDQKERYLYFISSAGFYAVNDRCELGGDNKTLLDNIGKLAERLGYTHTEALQHFAYGTGFYIRDHEVNPKQRCKLAPFLLDMTRAQIGF